MDILDIKGLTAFVGDKKILDDVSLTVKAGETCVIMGPNGSGKSTLANVLMGHPAYQVASGTISFNGTDITTKKPEERAALGLFLSFQQPREVEGVEFYPFLFDAYKSIQSAKGRSALAVFDFKRQLDAEVEALKVTQDWGNRYLNQGFSGGEKKKAEMLQLAMLRPTLAVFDEVDSGLDVDALEVVGQALKRFKTPETSALVITHYQRILKHIQPDKVVVMHKGKIIAIGGHDLAISLESEGFEKFISQL